MSGQTWGLRDDGLEGGGRDATAYFYVLLYYYYCYYIIMYSCINQHPHPPPTGRTPDPRTMPQPLDQAIISLHTATRPSEIIIRFIRNSVCREDVGVCA